METQTEQPTVEQTETATERTPMERVSENLETVKNFFRGQLKRYNTETGNKKRIELLKTITDRLETLAISEETALRLVQESKEFTGQRSIKWNNETLSFTNPKDYAASELRDKINNMNPSLGRLVYEAVLKAVGSWEDVSVALPCPWHTCRCNTHIKTERGVDGLFRTACLNPNHMKIETTIGSETENGSVDNWNRLVQNN